MIFQKTTEMRPDNFHIIYDDSSENYYLSFLFDKVASFKTVYPAFLDE